MNYEYCEGMTHTIKQGDTLYSISRTHKVPLAMILRANPYVDVYNLQPGDTICIPMRQTSETSERFFRNTDRDREERFDDDRFEDDRFENDNNHMNNMDDMNNRNNRNDMDNRNDMNNQGSMDHRNNMNNMNDMDDMDDMNNMNNQNNMENPVQMPDMGEGNRGSWTRYVAQSGDTLAEVMRRSDSDAASFWQKNEMEKMYLLPGIVYWIFEEE